MTKDQSDQNGKALIVLMIVFLTLLIISSLTSCTSSKVVYQMDRSGSWKPSPKASEMTGIVFNK